LYIALLRRAFIIREGRPRDDGDHGPLGDAAKLFFAMTEGDQVEVNYTEALALSVEPAPKPAAAKQK